jgi:transcriptional regulator with XRE-family HTH domain
MRAMANAPSDAAAPLRRRELATALRRRREALDLTAATVAQELGFSTSKISRIETGDRMVSTEDLDALCDLYNIDRRERTRLHKLAEESRKPGWWQKLDLIYSDYIGLEATATCIQQYMSESVPSLLQSAEYAESLERGHHPHSSERIIRERVEAKIQRQEILRRADPPKVEIVMSESVLHRVVGGTDQWRRQLRRMIELIESTRADVRVVAFEAGWHAGMDTSFTIMSFVEAVKDVVYCEFVHGDAYLDAPKELEGYRETFTRTQDSALDEQASLTLIKKIART